MDNWTQTNKNCEIKIPNFYKIVTECEPNAELIIQAAPLADKQTDKGTSADPFQPTTAVGATTTSTTTTTTQASDAPKT